MALSWGSLVRPLQPHSPLSCPSPHRPICQQWHCLLLCPCLLPVSPSGLRLLGCQGQVLEQDFLGNKESKLSGRTWGRVEAAMRRE